MSRVGEQPSHQPLFFPGIFFRSPRSLLLSDHGFHMITGSSFIPARLLASPFVSSHQTAEHQAWLKG